MIDMLEEYQGSIPAVPPTPKTNPSSGWFFFAYSRVFAGILADFEVP